MNISEYKKLIILSIAINAAWIQSFLNTHTFLIFFCSFLCILQIENLDCVLWRFFLVVWGALVPLLIQHLYLTVGWVVSFSSILRSFYCLFSWALYYPRLFSLYDICWVDIRPHVWDNMLQIRFYNHRPNATLEFKKIISQW